MAMSLTSMFCPQAKRYFAVQNLEQQHCDYPKSMSLWGMSLTRNNNKSIRQTGDSQQ
jgi:hypothetical protein